MNAPTTSHVLEIESGIGEPAFLPLRLGQEQQPISIGKKGMWKVESARVLDVHAFVYFDGQSLFVQSADERFCALVDGSRIGNAWTELRAPCTIEIGSARLRFRSLMAADGDGQPTAPMEKPMAHAPPGGPANAMPGPKPARNTNPPPADASALAQRGSAPPAQRPPTLRPPVPDVPAPAITAKPERPFRPGEFVSEPEEESTRVAPLDTTMASRARAAMANMHRPPAAGRPPELDEIAQARAMNSQPPQGFGPGMGPGPGFGMPPPVAGHPGMGPQGQPMGGGYPGGPGYPPGVPAMQGPYPGMGPGGPGVPQGTFGPGMPNGQQSVPNGFGSMTPQGGMPAPATTSAAGPSLGSKWKALSIPKRILIVIAPFSFASAMYLLLEEEPPPRPTKPVAAASSSALGPNAKAAGSGSVASTNAVPPVAGATGAGQEWPAGVPCPPPGWPADRPLPCTPSARSNTPVAAPSVETTAAETKTKGSAHKDHDIKDAGAKDAGVVKTPEREAVDLLTSGDLPKAAEKYDELARKDPSNPAYAEAARIARQRKDAGAP